MRSLGENLDGGASLSARGERGQEKLRAEHGHENGGIEP